MKSKTTVSHPFGNPAPFAEPAWHNVLESPYYNDSHRKLRAFVRDYLEKHIVPVVEEWEETGEVPLEEIVRWARSGLAFQDMPEKYRPGIGLPAGIPEKEWDIFHFIILHQETARVGYVGCLGDRHTFRQPLFRHQVIRHKLAKMARYIESHWAWIEQIAYHIKATGGIGPELSSRIALCKVQGGRLLELANREAQQISGGNGYQRGGIGGRVEQISRDLRMSIVGGGSEEIITDLAVRQEMKHAKARGSKL
ncbi:unnamed protein product [Clonostachys rhizophaga]|uniref:Acyl-CoA dehydrogenase/oxidase C-terminal domain-containing protein n=1 Tax=Clonostachys rhizophaga TaxID=160324 RepID=A0A9N9VKQ6_9HYPO|nr:unnamed protein product [Clonostachys rhizophaga]